MSRYDYFEPFGYDDLQGEINKLTESLVEHAGLPLSHTAHDQAIKVRLDTAFRQVIRKSGGSLFNAYGDPVINGPVERASRRSTETATITAYAGYFVHNHTTDEPRFIVSRDPKGHTNDAPGATYFATREDALQAIDVLNVVDGDGPKFWHLWRAVRKGQG